VAKTAAQQAPIRPTMLPLCDTDRKEFPILLLMCYVLGCLHQYAKSGLTKMPTESYAAQRRFLAA
jgi:hypothetical protein